MTQLNDMLDELKQMAASLRHIEELMRERLPVPLPADTCASCNRALDHFGSSPYCTACLERFTVQAESIK